MKFNNQDPSLETYQPGSDDPSFQAWMAVCAKVGHGEAGKTRAGGTTNQMREKRNCVRRAVNAISASLNGKTMDSQTGQAFDYAASLIARLDTDIDVHESMTNQNRNAGMKALRTPDDFAKHYGTQNAAHSFGDEITISDFIRGVGGLKTSDAVRNALTVGTDTQGGFTVPSHVMPGILAALAPVSSLLRAGAGIVPFEEGGKTFTTAALNTIPTSAWRAESGAVATSDPAFRAVVATPRSLAFQFKVSRELLADSKNIEEALRLVIAQSFARELDRVGLRGSGTAPEPRGILNTSGIQTVANGANGASLATLRFGNIFSAVQSLLQADAPMPTAAIMSPRSLVVLGQLADTTNQPIRVPGLLESMELIGSSQIPNALTVGSSVDCSEMYVGDFRNLYFAMRETMSIQVLTELYAGTGEIGFMCHTRADVVLTYPAAFCAVTGIRP